MLTFAFMHPSLPCLHAFWYAIRVIPYTSTFLMFLFLLYVAMYKPGSIVQSPEKTTL